MTKLTTFYIVRHGQTDWNVQEKVQGHSDIALNAEGEAQASLAAGDLKSIKFAAAFSSDLIRARRTAEIIAAEHKLAVKSTELLRERMYGTYEGVGRAELYEFYAKLNSLLEHERAAHYDQYHVESNEKMISRLSTFLRETALVYPGKNVLVVSHGGILHLLLCHIAGLNYATTRIRVRNTGYVKLESDGTEFYIRETKNVEIPEGINLITSS